MATKTVYCNNCKRDIGAGNFVIHSAHCERNIQLCNFCDEPVPRSEMEVHLGDSHAIDNCPLCSKEMERRWLEVHQKTCPKKLTSCKFCELELPFDRLVEHIINCETRTEKCPQCNEHVMLKDLDKHPEVCRKALDSKKYVICNYCGAKIYSDVANHLDTCGARTEKCSDCKSYVLLKDLQLHQCKKEKLGKLSVCEFCGENFYDVVFSEHVAICGSRTARCKKCDSYVMLRDKRDHPNKCPMEQVICEICGEVVPVVVLPQHVAFCASRTEKCLRCNCYVIVTDKKDHLNQCHMENAAKTLCEFCREAFPNFVLTEHVAFCGSKTEKCIRCDSYVKLRDRKHHLNNCLMEKSAETDCEYCRQAFPNNVLSEHVTYCGTRIEKCLRCDSYVQLRDKKDHTNECRMEKSAETICEFCTEAFPDVVLPEHVAFCGSRTEKCLRCDSYVSLKDKKDHPNKCHMPISNTMGECLRCHQQIPWMDMHMHESYCSIANAPISSILEQAVEISPPVQRNSDAIFSFRSQEDSNAQFQKYKSCSFCEERMPDLIFLDHLNTCDSRPYQCDLCLKSMPHKDKKNHKALCKAGELPKSDKMSYAEKKPKWHTQSCEENEFTMCPSCNSKIHDLELDAHLYSCYANRIKCKFCGIEVTKEHEHAHLQSCRLTESNQNRRSAHTSNKSSYGNMKRCKFCSQEIPIEHESIHLKLCSLSGGNQNNKRTFDSSDVHKGYAVANPVKTRHSEMSSVKTSFSKCPHCRLEILETDFTEHLRLCFADLIVCKYCCSSYHKNNEPKHLPDCVFFTRQIPADQDIKGKNKKKKDKKKPEDREQQTFMARLVTPIKKLTSSFKEAAPEAVPQPTFDLLPCEFCEELFPMETIIEHQSGCRPDIVCYPKFEEPKTTHKGPPLLNHQAEDFKPVCRPDMLSSPKFEEGPKATRKRPAQLDHAEKRAPPSLHERFVTRYSDTMPRELLKNTQSPTQTFGEMGDLSRYNNIRMYGSKEKASSENLVGSAAESRKLEHSTQRLEEFNSSSSPASSVYNQQAESKEHMKAIGAERAKNKDILQFTLSDTMDSNCNKDEGSSMPADKEKVSNHGNNLLFNYDKDLTFGSNKSASSVWGPLEIEADSKNDETFPTDSKKLSLPVENASDSEDAFFDAEDWKTLSNEVKNGSSKVMNAKEENISNSLNENCDLDACFQFLKKSSEIISNSQDLQNDNLSMKVSNSRTDCECGNEICYCSLNKQPSALEEKVFCSTENFKGARPKKSLPPVSNLQQTGATYKVMDYESLCMLKNSNSQRKSDDYVPGRDVSNKDRSLNPNSWNQWRSKKSSDSSD